MSPEPQFDLGTELLWACKAFGIAFIGTLLLVCMIMSLPKCTWTKKEKDESYHEPSKAKVMTYDVESPNTIGALKRKVNWNPKPLE
eukprot:522132-Amorphochlora_amoeboformis.AAC.1